MANIVLGSVVQLKSGSSKMVVDTIISATQVLCVWQDVQQNEHRGIYSLTSLNLIA